MSPPSISQSLAELALGTQTSLLTLPLELVRQCLDAAVVLLELRDFMRLRLVCKLFHDEVPSLIHSNRLLEDESHSFRREALESRARPHQDRFLAKYLSARVKSERHNPKKSYFVKSILEIVEAMKRASSPVTVEDVCLGAAVHGPLRLILQSLREPGKEWTGSLNHVTVAAVYFGQVALVEQHRHNCRGSRMWSSIVGHPLQVAAAQGRADIMFTILDTDRGFTMSRSLSHRHHGDFWRLMELKRGWTHYCTVSHAAAAAGQIDLLRQFLGPWEHSIRYPDGYDWAIPRSWEDLLVLITLASANGHVEMVTFLMKERHREWARTKRHLHFPAILQTAAANGHEELVRWCLAKGTADELEERHTCQPRSAYVAAAAGGHINIMRILPIEGKWKFRHLEGAMSRAAHFGYIRVAQQVLKDGFDLNASTMVWIPEESEHHLRGKARKFGRWVTPLVAAIDNEQVEMVGFLLESGLDLDQNEQLREMAFTLAADWSENQSILKMLQANSKYPRVQGDIFQEMDPTSSSRSYNLR